MIDVDDDGDQDDEGKRDPVETATEEEREGRSSRDWLRLIEEAEKVFDPWQDRCGSIDKLYASMERLANVGRDREFQLFWANVQVLGPSIYARPPVPVVVPRFKDRRPLPRQAAELLERASIVNAELEDLHHELKQVRDDLTVSARGAIWLRYEASGKGANFKERACFDHLDRKDFLHDPARKWKDVDWAARRAWLSRTEMRKRFKASSGDAYKDATYSVRYDEKEGDKGRKKAGVWELWSKSKNRVVWVAEGVDIVLDEGPPHLKLDGFFPCPRPAYATLQRRTLVPVPDFLFYKDQIEEINELTGRIAALAEAVKVRGFYPAGAGDVADAIEAAVKSISDNQVLVPVANWAMVGNGGVKDMIVWLPIDQVVGAIKELIGLRKQLIDDVYQITGLSDIMRGETEASETLGAQQLKSQYGSIRISDRKGEMVRLARDAIRIAAEIMAENFAAKTFLAMTQLEVATEAAIAQQAAPLKQQLGKLQLELRQVQADPQAQAYAKQNPQQAEQILGQVQQQMAGLQAQLAKLGEVPTVEKIMELLQAQAMRPYVLDIETDSTIAPDENAQKQRATEFVTAVGGFMEKALPAVQGFPQASPVIAGLLKFVAGQFRAGRELEGLIDEFADKMAQAASQPKAPDPKAAKEAADAQTAQTKAQTDAANAAQEREIAAAQERDAAEQRRVDREGKVAVTNKQIELMEAESAQRMSKGVLEMGILRANLARANAEARAAGTAPVDDTAAESVMQAPMEALLVELHRKQDRLADLIAAPNVVIRDDQQRIVGSRKQVAAGA